MPTSTNSLQESIMDGLLTLGTYLGLSADDPRIIAARLIRVAIGFLGILFVILILWAGFLWMVSGGKDEQVSKAKGVFYNAVIGLIIILSAYSIVTFVLGAVLP